MGMAGYHVGLWRETSWPHLERDFEIVAYDKRGIGESTDVPGPFTIAELAQDAVAVLDAARLGQRARLRASRWAAWSRRSSCVNHPERVRRLVLGCTYCGGPRTNPMAPGPMRMMTAMNSGDIEAALRAGFEANLSPAWAADDAHWRSSATSRWRARVPVPVVHAPGAGGVRPRHSTRLPAVAAPTLVMAGTADEMVLYANNEVIASLIPGATMHPLPDAGHLFWWERPDEVVEAITKHLTG